MVNLGSMLRQRPPQRGQGQCLIQLPAQMPTPNAARIDIHQHGQGDELLPQAHVGDIPDPHLIWADARQSLHQIRVAWGGMGALGRPDVPRGGVPLETHRAHEPRHVLAIDRPAVALQQGRDAAITIRRPGLGETYKRPAPYRFIAGPRAIILKAARIPQDTADQAHRIGVAKHLDYLP
jgi:hypothetical protein